MASSIDFISAQNKTLSSPGKYRPEIDGLRAFAVVAVIINHFNKQLLPNGYLGVDIFFVISGYVITSSLAGRKARNFLDFVKGFYERRIKRLLPALALFVLVTSALICLFNPDPSMSLEVGWRSLFGISNINLYQTATDYFAPSSELNPFTHTWSLGVEEQFYIVFPFLIWFSGFGRQAVNGARNLFFWVGALTIISLLTYIYLYQFNQPAAYFLMPPRFWEMAAGCLLFIAFQKRATIEQKLERVPPLLVLAGMMAVMLRPMGARTGTIAIVVMTAVLIACLKKGTAGFRLFTSKKVVYIGLISYSLYLWHWSVLCISRWTIGIHWWTAPFQVGVMLVLAVASYKFVERPARISTTNLGKKFVFATGFAAALISSLLIKTLSAQSKGIFQYSNPQVRWVERKYLNGTSYNTWVLAKSATKSAKEISDSKKIIKRCLTTGLVSTSDLRNCLGAGIPSANQDGRIFVIGDSHANAYSHGIKSAFPDRDVRSYTAGFGCSYLPKLIAIKNGKSRQFNCLGYVENIDSFVASYLIPGDMVVLGMDWRDGGAKKGAPGLATAILSLASRVISQGASFVLLDDVPELGEPLLCQQTWYRPFTPATCIKSIGEVARDQLSLDAIGQQVSSLSNNRARYVSLRSDLCEKKSICSIYLDGIQIFRDNGHITEDAAIRYTTNTFKRELSPLLFRDS